MSTIRKIITLISDLPRYLYHISYINNLNNIKRKGLLNNKGERRVSWFSSKPSKLKSNNIVHLRVNPRNLEKDSLFDVTNLSRKNSRTIIYKENIFPDILQIKIKGKWRNLLSNGK